MKLAYVLHNVEIPIYIVPEFRDAFEEASQYSGLGVYRMHWLWRAVQQVAKLPAGDILEVGTHKGGSALMIQRAMQHAGLACRLTACDTFAGLVKASELDVWRNKEMVYSDVAAVEALLPGAQILQGVFPEDTAWKLGDTSLRLVHIDVDIYQSAKDIWTYIWPKLVPGGLVVFDDCEIADTPGITQLITELEAQPGSIWFRNHMGQATCVKL